MAVYKVIQDIEAEDKLLGPLTLKGFIYAAIAGVCAFIEFRLLVSGFGAVKFAAMLLFLPPMVLFGVLASPLGREQPTEVWLLSHIKFLLKPRRHIWDQNSLPANTVTITAPKKVDKQRVKDISQSEVKSRLAALASTLDSRGWAVKNVAVNLYTSPGYMDQQVDNSDRLIESSSVPAETPVLDIHPSDDILDEQNNPTAQNFQNLMVQAEEKRKKEIAAKLEAARQAKVQAQKPAPAKAVAAADSTGLTSEEEQLLNKLHARDKIFEGQHIITKRTQREGSSDQPSVTGPSQAVKLELANAGNDLSVASIARLVNQKSGPGEVVIPLH